MFNNLQLRPKSQLPAESDEVPGTASQRPVSEAIPQPTNAPTNTPNAKGHRPRNKYVKVDMSDFELFTPVAHAQSEQSARALESSGNESDLDMSCDDQSSWYSSAALQAKSMAKKNPQIGSGVGAILIGSRWTAKNSLLKSERGSSRQSPSSRSGITKKTSNVRGRGHTLGHRPKSSSTTGKLDSISVSTWEAYTNLNNLGKDDDTDDESCSTVDLPTLWYALSCIPGFSFPALYSFLHESHAWVLLDMTGHGDGEGGNDSGTVYNTEDCIDSLNIDMPLGRRAQALERLASILSSPAIQRVCGNSIVRKRVPNFIRTVMGEPSRIWSIEAAAVGRQLSFLVAALERNDGSFRDRSLSPMPLAASLDRVLARRFNLSAPNTRPSLPVDVNIMSDGGAAPSSTSTTTVDGNALAVAMQDLMSILASARRLFEKRRALLPLQEPAIPAATREQQGVYKAFDTANTTMQRLQDFQRQLSHCEVNTNGQLTMEDDLVDSMQSALGAMQ